MGDVKLEPQQIQYKLPSFEGPLDLLLTLISKNKIDIYDIQISELVDQYVEQIKLGYIKSVMLLPKYEEEAEELKKELTGQLIEYALCRQIAQKLSEIYDTDTFFRDASPVEYDLTYNRKHPSEDIAKAYVSAVGRGKRRLPPPESAFSGIVARKIVSVNSRIIYVMRKLWRGKRLKYNELFEACEEKSELVATFLATLELVKGKRVRVEGDGENAEVYMLDKKKGEEQNG